ncbi:MAG TPA: glycoside hydrolase family 16 protein [Polyangiaceae bacterium]|nr:glycoside hydrolase family 16 protein [Polyangiaceae bacterium]
MFERLCTCVGCLTLVIACSSDANSGNAGAAAGSAHGGIASGGTTSGGTTSGGTANGAAGSSQNEDGGRAGSAHAGANTGGAAQVGASAGHGGTASGGAAGGNASGAAGKSAGGAAGTGGASSVGCTSTTAGYKLVWSDEFNGEKGSAVDSTKWTYDVGGTGWGNDELEYYTSGSNNAALDGAGNLLITAKQESMGGKNYTSARLKTQGLYSFTYGRVEARMKIPQGQGLWPAFWMLGTDIATNPWPACGEIDIMENIGKEPNIIHATIHGPGYSAGSGPTKQYTLSAPVASAFHVFAIEWEPNTIRWYVDDTQYSTKTPSDIPSSATWAYAHPFFILMNVAVGGGWPGNPDSTTTFPQQLQVDYVRVCQK